jgi:hypothetical protein
MTSGSEGSEFVGMYVFVYVYMYVNMHVDMYCGVIGNIIFNYLYKRTHKHTESLCEHKNCCMKLTKTKLRGRSPQANYTDRATAACRRS